MSCCRRLFFKVANQSLDLNFELEYLELMAWLALLAIYPVDSVIQPSNNRGLVTHFSTVVLGEKNNIDCPESQLELYCVSMQIENTTL